MADEGRAIYTFIDMPFECPHCGHRLDFGNPVDEDSDGPIYEGECSLHGPFLVQAVEEPDEDD